MMFYTTKWWIKKIHLNQNPLFLYIKENGVIRKCGYFSFYDTSTVILDEIHMF